MNHLKIYKDEVSDLAWAEYSNMPHAKVCEDYIVFYTVADPHSITEVCTGYVDLISDRNECNDAEDYDAAFEIECRQRELAEELIDLIEH